MKVWTYLLIASKDNISFQSVTFRAISISIHHGHDCKGVQAIESGAAVANKALCLLPPAAEDVNWEVLQGASGWLPSSDWDKTMKDAQITG